MGPSGVHGGESGLSRNEPTRVCDCPWKKPQSLRQVRAGLQAPRSRLQAPPAAVQGQEGSSSVPLPSPSPAFNEITQGTPRRGPRWPSRWHLLGSLCQPRSGRNSSGERPVQEEEVGKHPPGSTAAVPDEANKPPRRWGSEPLGPWAQGRAQGSKAL